jgi:hypothetical protein
MCMLRVVEVEVRELMKSTRNMMIVMLAMVRAKLTLEKYWYRILCLYQCGHPWLAN